MASRLVFPVQGGGKYTDTWGAPRADTGRHKGTDIFAPRGTPVVAVADGTVTKIGWNSLGGWRVWLNGTFYYAHLSGYGPGIVQGAKVKAGQVLGYVGNTGDARGGPTHLHFGYDPNGTSGASWANPYPILRGQASPTYRETVGTPGGVAASDPSELGLAPPVLPGMPPGPETAGPPSQLEPGAGYPVTPPEPPQSQSWRLISAMSNLTPETLRYAQRQGT